MNREDVIRWAREAGFHQEGAVCKNRGYELERFAALVAAAKEQEMLERIRHIIVQAEERGAAAERDRMCEQFNIPKELAHEKATSNETD